MKAPTVDISRRQQAAYITDQIIGSRSFSFLRLGDGELSALINIQNGNPPRTHFRSTEDQMRLLVGDYPRLRAAYESCDFLDTYERVEFNRRHVAELRLQPKPTQQRCFSPSTTHIIFDWTIWELPRLLAANNVVVAGGEARLISELLKEPEYLEAARGMFPNIVDLICIPIINGGIGYWQHINTIKNALRLQMRSKANPVLMLSLSSAAKIVCAELAAEEKVRAIDFGAALRALSCSATSGASSSLSSHMPHFFATPLSTFIKAAVRAFPHIDTYDFARKLNRQLLLNFIDVEPGQSLALRSQGTGQFQLSGKTVDRFREDLSVLLAWQRKLSLIEGFRARWDLYRILNHFSLQQALPKGMRGQARMVLKSRRFLRPLIL